MLYDPSMASEIDMMGSRFGRLEVVRKSTRPENCKHTRTMWECRCDCGNIVVVVGKSLRQGYKKSCGCLLSETARRVHRKEKGHSGSRELYHSYRLSAKKRGLEFDISWERFQDITKQPCHFCGDPPGKVHRSRHKRMTEIGVEHSSYVFNGIDRLDNEKGYVPGNIVTCCHRCNYAKRDMSVEDFLKWARRLVKHNEHSACEGAVSRPSGEGSVVGQEEEEVETDAVQAVG